MNQLRTEDPTSSPARDSRPAAATGPAASKLPGGELVRLTCSVCEKGFVLDLDEEWGAPPEDIEVEGRDFLDIRKDAALCPRCLHSVKVAGAERVYWRLAHC